MDDKLTYFISYLQNYLHAYRKKFSKTTGDEILLRFLVGDDDTVNIYCKVNEPVNPAFKVGDFWFSGSLLRKCISVTAEEDYGTIRTYNVCYQYHEAFASTVVSLNPTLDDGNSTNYPSPPPPSPPGSIGTGDQILSGGGTMDGPLYLRKSIVDPREAVNKGYVDTLIASQQKIINDLSLLVSQSVAESAQAKAAVSQLNQDLGELKNIRVIRVTKTIPQKDWLVNHNHGSRFVVVQVLDDVGIEIFPEQIEVSPNTVNIKFSVPITGRATIVLIKE